MFGGKKLIVYELNEVPLKVFQWFGSRYPDSTIAHLLDQGTVVETYAADEGHLSPWVTWPTVHRGVTNALHHIYDFGQDLRGVNSAYPPIWDLIARSGHKVGVFGSLHSYPLPPNLDNYLFYVPDTFAAGTECFPQKFSAFQQFNLRMVDRSGRNVSGGVPVGTAAKFLLAAPALGLRGVTVAKLARQLTAEIGNPARVVRRRTSQAQIAFDFFMSELKRTRPDYSTFFTNHVASAMHRYWPALFPEDYKAPHWNDSWRMQWADEIPFAMREADAQLHRLRQFVSQHSEFALVILTSMGQAAQEEQERVETQLNFFDIQRFMRVLGFTGNDWQRERAMAPLYMVRVRPGLVNQFSSRSQQVTINGVPLSAVSRGEGVFRIELGQYNLQSDAIELKIDGRTVPLSEAGMVNLRIQDEAGSNAYHIPEGVLIAYSPNGRAQIAERLSTVQIAPALLANFRVPSPDYMAGFPN